MTVAIEEKKDNSFERFPSSTVRMFTQFMLDDMMSLPVPVQ